MEATDRTVPKKVCLMTLGCIAAAVLISNLCLYAMLGSLDEWRLTTLIAVVAAGFIAPIASYSNVSMAYRLQQANRRLKELSETDPLTETVNRRRFMEVAEQQLALAQRHSYPTSLLLLDLDHFKQINDQYGHATGDRALVEITEVVRAELRESDTLARFGGEEFVVLLPHTAREGALAVAERIRSGARRHVIHAQDAQEQTQPMTVTISIGGITCETSTTPLDTLVSRADTLLYQAKQSGRDRSLVEAIPAASPLPFRAQQAS